MPEKFKRGIKPESGNDYYLISMDDMHLLAKINNEPVENKVILEDVYKLVSGEFLPVFYKPWIVVPMSNIFIVARVL